MMITKYDLIENRKKILLIEELRRCCSKILISVAVQFMDDSDSVMTIKLKSDIKE